MAVAMNRMSEFERVRATFADGSLMPQNLKTEGQLLPQLHSVSNVTVEIKKDFSPLLIEYISN